jgi:hypothetical protein
MDFTGMGFMMTIMDDLSSLTDRAEGRWGSRDVTAL